MEGLIHIYENLPGIVQYVINFVFTVLFMRGIVANTLINELKQRWHKNQTKDRYVALWFHWIDRHVSGDSILACRQNHCGTL